MKARADISAKSRNFFRSDKSWPTLALCLVIAALTGVVYFQTRTHPFLGGDDYLYIVDNQEIHSGLHWSTVRWAFTALNMVNWIPLTWLLHAVNYHYFYLEPAGHHIVNVVLHALDAMLLFCVLKRATGYTGRSFMVAALFALHPINVESVAWVAELKTMLSTMFLLLALAAYRWYAQEPGAGRYVMVASMFGLALMSKPQVIMLPLVLLLWDYWPLQRLVLPGKQAFEETDPPLIVYPRKSLRWLAIEKLPLLALSALDGLITLRVQGVNSAYWSTTYSLSVRVANAIVSYARYIGKAFWPAWLAIDYPHPGHSITVWQTLGSVALLAIITELVLLSHRKYLVVGWFWFLLTLLPMIGLVQVGMQAMADRYAYDSFWGLFIMVCWGAADYAKKFRISTPWLAGASVLVLVALTVTTYRQIGYWSSTYELFLHASRVVHNDWKAEDVLGDQLRARHNFDAAKKHFYQANAMNPYDPWSNREVGYYEQASGDPAGAIEHYKRSLRTDDLSPQMRALVWRNMGVAYRDMGDMSDARECFRHSQAPDTR
jgi:hypothetical protein